MIDFRRFDYDRLLHEIFLKSVDRRTMVHLLPSKVLAGAFLLDFIDVELGKAVLVGTCFVASAFFDSG